MPPNEGDNANFVQLREQYNNVVNDNKTVKEQLEKVASDKAALEARLAEIERANMSEIERVKSINEEVTGKLNELSEKAKKADQLEEVIKQRDAKLFESYESQLSRIPEDKREVVKKLTLDTSDPIKSLDLLNTQLTLLDIKPLQQGVVTQPVGGDKNNGTETERKPLNPKNISWDQAFAGSREKINKQLEERRRR